MGHEAPAPAGPGVPAHEVLAELDPFLEDLPGEVTVVGSPLPEPLRRLAGSPARVVEAFPAPDSVDPAGPAVSIVSYLSMWQPHGSTARLERLRRRLPAGSRVVFVEPTLGVGAAAGLQRAGRVIAVKRLGLSFHRDIPEELRRAGFEVTSVVRFSLGFPERLLTFVAGEARVYDGSAGHYSPDRVGS